MTSHETRPWKNVASTPGAVSALYEFMVSELVADLDRPHVVVVGDVRDSAVGFVVGPFRDSLSAVGAAEELRRRDRMLGTTTGTYQAVPLENPTEPTSGED
ncbi:MAG TPA: hypothetical protein VM575_09305 [Nocardioides sp.]|nr:hypothetical protein [Nocardioides sp.]